MSAIGGVFSTAYAGVSEFQVVSPPPFKGLLYGYAASYLRSSESGKRKKVDLGRGPGLGRSLLPMADTTQLPSTWFFSQVACLSALCSGRGPGPRQQWAWQWFGTHHVRFCRSWGCCLGLSVAPLWGTEDLGFLEAV